MQQPEEFSAYRAEQLEGRYDCVDRTRRHLGAPRLRTLFGQKNRPHQCLGKLLIMLAELRRMVIDFH